LYPSRFQFVRVEVMNSIMYIRNFKSLTGKLHNYYKEYTLHLYDSFFLVGYLRGILFIIDDNFKLISNNNSTASIKLLI